MKYKLKKSFKHKGKISDDLSEQDLTDPAVLDVIMQSQEFAAMFPDVKKEFVNQQNAEAINAVLDEFFDAFFLIGIDPKGDGHFIRNHRNFQQKAVLRHLLERYVMEDDGDSDLMNPFDNEN